MAIDFDILKNTGLGPAHSKTHPLTHEVSVAEDGRKNPLNATSRLDDEIREKFLRGNAIFH